MEIFESTFPFCCINSAESLMISWRRGEWIVAALSSLRTVVVLSLPSSQLCLSPAFPSCLSFLSIGHSPEVIAVTHEPSYDNGNVSSSWAHFIWRDYSFEDGKSAESDSSSQVIIDFYEVYVAFWIIKHCAAFL